uniref:Uncharacterized protein n=1 Tax=Panagrellus redivivus TaxID=6233 RepID=A0A7E4UPT3_PANRE
MLNDAFLHFSSSHFHFYRSSDQTSASWPIPQATASRALPPAPRRPDVEAQPGPRLGRRSHDVLMVPVGFMLSFA